MSDDNVLNIDHAEFAESFDSLGLQNHAKAFRLLEDAKEHIANDELEQAEELITGARRIAQSIQENEAGSSDE